MATTFTILDKSCGYGNCPMGIEDVYEMEFYNTFKEKYPEKFVDDPDMDPVDHPDYNDLFEDNTPQIIHDMEYEEQLEWSVKVLKANKCNLRHGDVVWIGGEDYRNTGIHFWDAKNNKIIPMETRIADYGHVPKRFAVGKGEGEFCSHHWDGISNYNNLEPYWSSKSSKWFYPSNGECPCEIDTE